MLYSLQPEKSGENGITFTWPPTQKNLESIPGISFTLFLGSTYLARISNIFMNDVPKQTLLSCLILFLSIFIAAGPSLECEESVEFEKSDASFATLLLLAMNGLGLMYQSTSTLIRFSLPNRQQLQEDGEGPIAAERPHQLRSRQYRCLWQQRIPLKLLRH